jgi:hypothetical protein
MLDGELAPGNVTAPVAGSTVEPGGSVIAPGVSGVLGGKTIFPLLASMDVPGGRTVPAGIPLDGGKVTAPFVGSIVVPVGTVVGCGKATSPVVGLIVDPGGTLIAPGLLDEPG